MDVAPGDTGQCWCHSMASDGFSNSNKKIPILPLSLPKALQAPVDLRGNESPPFGAAPTPPAKPQRFMDTHGKANGKSSTRYTLRVVSGMDRRKREGRGKEKGNGHF